MCWIFWYHGNEDQVVSILLHGLQKLEYRGYDSAGIFVGDSLWNTALWRAVGKVANLAGKVTNIEHWKFQTTDVENNTYYGIAHTRRATHGGVTELNCHPHTSNDGKIFVVHNGIIENYRKLKLELEQKWYTFMSATDTEIIANLLQEEWTGNLKETVQIITGKLIWAYALLIVHTDFPDEMIGVRWGSPLLFGYNKKRDFFFSSDSQALSGYAEKLIFLEEGDMLVVKNKDFTIVVDGKIATRSIENVDPSLLEVSKGKWKHFMLKEIYEQAAIIQRIYKGRLNFGTGKLTADAFHGMQDEHYTQMTFVACGTASYAGRLASLRMEELAKIESKLEIASEYENKRFFIHNKKLHVFVSQSGETADSLECLRLIKEQGGKTFGIVNVVGSSIARLTDSWLFTRAGTEISVASTKAFIAQITSLLLTALYLAKKRGMRHAHYLHIVYHLEQLPMLVETILDQSEYIRSIAEQLMWYDNFFFLWRHYQEPIAHEASLKLKEITYLHAEAYPAGELKHGSLALIDSETPSIFLMPHDLMFEKNLSTLQEIKARKGKVLVVSDKKVDGADRQISIPESIPEIYPFLTTVVWQLLAYHVADLLWRDIDKPRNLAKSVTVK